MNQKSCSNPECKQQNPQPLENFHRDAKKKDGLRSRCKSCEIEAAKRYRDANKEIRAKNQREYYQKHGDIQRAASIAWKRENSERVKEYFKGWYSENRDNRLEYHKEYAAANPSGVLERSRKRRAKSFGLDEHFTEAEFFKKFNALGRKCFYCEAPLTDETVTRDHYIALVRGGSDAIDNIVPCCAMCNSRKRNKGPEEYIKSLGNHEPSRANGIK